jgi:hypothetical protein
MEAFDGKSISALGRLKTKKSDLLISHIFYHTPPPFVKEITQKMPLEKGIFWLSIAVNIYFLTDIKIH